MVQVDDMRCPHCRQWLLSDTDRSGHDCQEKRDAMAFYEREIERLKGRI